MIGTSRVQLKAPRVVGHFPSQKEKADSNSTVQMFVEDLWLGIMPIIRGVRPPAFSVAIQASCENRNRVITILDSLTARYGYNQDSSEELLSASVSDLALKLAPTGRAVHEIIREKKNNRPYRLYGFTHDRLIHAFGRYMQIIPKAEHSRLERTHVIVPEEDIWDITVPRVLGGCRSYRKTLRKLARFPYPAPSFLTNEVSAEQWHEDLDLDRYVREVRLFTSKATAKWGWIHRDRELRHWTEFYAVYRHIKLNWAQACIREHIVNELNQLFRRLHVEAEIVVTGLPTAQEILGVLERMCNGDISLTDACDAY